jgi:hypothetical protein
MVVTTPHTKMSRVRGSMTNNNGFWIRWLDLLIPSFTIALIYNPLEQLTINDCLRLASFLTRLRVSSIVTDLVLIYDWSLLLRMTYEWITTPDSNDDCILTEFSSDSITTDSINYVSSLCNSGTNRIEIAIANSLRYWVLIRCRGNVC